MEKNGRGSLESGALAAVAVALYDRLERLNGATAIESLIKIFERTSGLKTNHCAIRADDILEFDGPGFHLESDPIPAHRDLERHTKELASKVRRNRMAKPSEASRRLTEFKNRIEGKTDALLAKLDGAEKKVDPAFDRANEVLDAHSAEVDAMESELRQLSNIPLGK
jgi:adenine-specific DNA methylase